jgi:UDP-N-acetyl-D-mannosaminuronic acid dehydrogenase
MQPNGSSHDEAGWRTPTLTRRADAWRVRKIAVIGPGIVGMPMAALLAYSQVRIGTDAPARVVVLQRRSPTSGWKVDAINGGRSSIGGIEPELDAIVARTVESGLLSASDDYAEVRDADVILVCVQTDKDRHAPDYGPLMDALTRVAEELVHRAVGHRPLIVIESTLAPSSMQTVIREHFARFGLEEGRDVLLGNSPNRVMPGRLVDRIRSSDKLVAGLRPETPERIGRLYRNIVTRGTLHCTNSLTAEVVKTLENAYRDVRIAFAAEVAHYCDTHDIDFYELRERVNRELLQVDEASIDPHAVPHGALLVPTVGVGGHCLPKDGVLLWWRAIENGLDADTSLILEARHINDASPARTLALAERHARSLAHRDVALLGVAYRGDSDDTRNSPTLALARLLLERGARVRLHDPFVRPTDPNLLATGMDRHFMPDLRVALGGAAVAIVCAPHRPYVDQPHTLLAAGPKLQCVVDACNAFPAGGVAIGGPLYFGIGRGLHRPSDELTSVIYDAFRVVERGVANEVAMLVQFLNERYAGDEFARIDYQELQRLAGTCSTGCELTDPGWVAPVRAYMGFHSRLAERAAQRR